MNDLELRKRLRPIIVWNADIETVFALFHDAGYKSPSEVSRLVGIKAALERTPEEGCRNDLEPVKGVYKTFAKTLGLTPGQIGNLKDK